MSLKCEPASEPLHISYGECFGDGRQKEQFSDGVGYGWIDGLKDHAASVVSDQMFRVPPPFLMSDKKSL